MSVQARRDNTTVPFIRNGIPVSRNNEILLQDAGRAIVLAQYTLMAQVAATKKWVPFTDETAVDGTAIAKGIYMGDDIAAADIVAGDVVNFSVIIGGDMVPINTALLVIENALTLDTIVGVGTVEAHRVEDDLNEIGIFPESTVDVDGLET